MVNDERNLSTMLRTAYIILISILLALPVFAAECPLLPEQAQQAEQEASFKKAWQWVSAPYSVYDYVGNHDRAPLGVGHLQVEHTSDGGGYYDWPNKIMVPIWDKPHGDQVAWVRSGLVIPTDGTPAYPLNGAGMVETDYEQLTFIVIEERDGWIKLRYNSGDEGVGWTHRCHLNLGEVALNYQSWQTLLKEKGDWLHFRSEVAHILREKPSTESPQVTKIGLNHKLELIQLQGDWMQVKVIQPDLSCSGSTQPFEGTVHKGWVKWRDNTIGPWVWYYTRGC
jgi:hypothetical protein